MQAYEHCYIWCGIRWTVSSQQRSIQCKFHSFYLFCYFCSVSFWPELNAILSDFATAATTITAKGSFQIEFMFVAHIWLSICCVYVPVRACVRLFVCVTLFVCKMAFNRIILWFVFSMVPYYDINPYASYIYNIHFTWHIHLVIYKVCACTCMCVCARSYSIRQMHLRLYVSVCIW